jgi:hemoglobin
VQVDLDSGDRIAGFIDAFYARVLDDTLLAPLFLEVAGIDLEEHLPHIRAYWCKMLLGESGYSRHMMARHRALDGKVKLTGPHYRRWLQLFEETLREKASGPRAEQARDLARRIAGNMQRNLAQHCIHSTDDKNINY